MKENTDKAIGQNDLNRVIDMWRSICTRTTMNLDEFLHRMNVAWPEYNIAYNHSAVVAYINERVPVK